jgi:hypothetical protein
MNTKYVVLVAVVAATLLACGTSCRETPNQPSTDGLVQSVRLDPAEPRKGETVIVYSTIENRGTSPKPVTYMVCQLGLEGDLLLSIPLDETRCAAVSATTDVPPGKIVQLADRRVVNSPAGVYSLRVEHLIDPQRSITVRVRVRD